MRAETLVLVTTQDALWGVALHQNLDGNVFLCEVIARFWCGGETAKSLPECKTESRTFLIQMFGRLKGYINQYQKRCGKSR